MHDQASELRQLVRRASGAEEPAAENAPQMIIVCGGKGGVGTTTLAVNLAVALARLGPRIVLVDGDFDVPDVAELCQLQEAECITEVLSGRRSVQEVLQSGPAGVEVLPGAWAAECAPYCSAPMQQRLIDQLKGQQADMIVVDAGSGLKNSVRRFWDAADLVLMVTTPDAVSILDAYTAIKALQAGSPDASVCTLVNRAPSAIKAKDVHQRIAQVSHRFLGIRVKAAGNVLEDDSIRWASKAPGPMVLQSPRSAAARSIERIAQTLQRRPIRSNQAPRRRDAIVRPLQAKYGEYWAEGITESTLY